MKAMLLKKVCDMTTNDSPLELVSIAIPVTKDNEILIKISCCGICHTELDEIEGRVRPSIMPIIPGHQVIGYVEKKGKKVSLFKEGDRVGVAWIFSSCGKCEYCVNGKENLCPDFKGTGKDANGGYAEYMTVSENFAYLIPAALSDTEAAPLLCAGAIGYRSLMLTNIKNGQTLGLAGFGASGHLVLKTAKYLFPDSKIVVFARSREERDFAQSLGASWVGDFTDSPLDIPQAIIDTTPVWKTIVHSLENIKPGGRLVINAIRKESIDKSELLNINYEKHLWMEKEIKSVTNITRSDVKSFLELAVKINIKPEIEIYPFNQANNALFDLKNKRIKGAKVLMINEMKSEIQNLH